MPIFNTQVSASGDDMHLDLSVSGFSYSNTANPMDIGSRFGTVGWSNIYHFTNITIGQGETINDAFVTVTAGATGSNDSVHVIVSLEDADNPSAPTSHADSTGRTLTTANTDIAALPAFVSGNTYNIDCTSAVQEVINRGGWSNGNAMNIFIVSQADTGGTALRQVTSYGGSPSSAPELTIDFGGAVVTTFKPKIISY